MLTPAERRIALLVARGSRNDAIAGELGVSAKTVEWHLSNVYRKLGVGSRTELAIQLAGEARWQQEEAEPK